MAPPFQEQIYTAQYGDQVYNEGQRFIEQPPMSTGRTLLPEYNAHPLYASSVSHDVDLGFVPPTPMAFRVIPLPPMSPSLTAYDAAGQTTALTDAQGTEPYEEQGPWMSLLQSSAEEQAWWDAAMRADIPMTADDGNQDDTSLMQGLLLPQGTRSLVVLATLSDNMP